MPNRSLINALINVLEQEQLLLANLDPRIYTAPGRGAFRSSIGAHIRHNLDHFTSFFDGLPMGRIDYEARRRDDGISQFPEHALADIGKHLDALGAWTAGTDDGRTLQVREESDDSAVCELRWLDSSVGRELQFLLGHTVHHHAIIALLLYQHEVPLPDGFGVAPSTQRHEQNRSAVAAS